MLKVYYMFYCLYQMTLMPEIRNWVRGCDLDKFDVLLQRREVSIRCLYELTCSLAFINKRLVTQGTVLSILLGVP